MKLSGKINFQYIFNIGIVLLLALLFWQFRKTESTAYVNSQILLQRYEGTKKASDEFRKRYQQWQSDTDTLYNSIQTDIKNYEQKVNRMSAAERQSRKQEITKRQNDLLKYQEAMKQKIMEEEQKSADMVLDEVNRYLTDYGKEHSYTIILTGTKGTVAYVGESIDITEEVIEGLNKRYRGGE